MQTISMVTGVNTSKHLTDTFKCYLPLWVPESNFRAALDFSFCVHHQAAILKCNLWFSVQNSLLTLALAGLMWFHCGPPSWHSLSGSYCGLKWELSNADFSCCQKWKTERERVGYKRILSCPFWLFFVLILVQIPSVWLCNCRLSVSRGLPWEVGMIHSLLSLSFLSCFWCWFCVWFCYAWLYMLLVIMPIEGVIPKAKEIEEELNWRSVVVWKKTATFLFIYFFSSGYVSKNVSVEKQDPV